MSMDFSGFGSQIGIFEKIKSGIKGLSGSSRSHADMQDYLTRASAQERALHRMHLKSQETQQAAGLASQERMQSERLRHERDLHSTGHTQRTEHFNAGFSFAQANPGAQVQVTFPEGGGYHVTTPKNKAAEAAKAPRPRRKKGEGVQEPMITERGNVRRNVI